MYRGGGDLARFMDAAAPALLVAQAIGLVGNYFNQELFGRPTWLPWALEIDPDHRPACYLAETTFHPTFLYELIWDLALAAGWCGSAVATRSARPASSRCMSPAIGAFRIVEELLRVDPTAHVLGLRWNFILAVAGTLAGLAWFAHTQRHPRQPHRSQPAVQH